jgi:hypothetical protein
MSYSIFVKKIGKWKKRMDDKVFVRVIKQRIEDFAINSAIPVYKMTTQTWKEHDPKFVYRRFFDSPNIFRLAVGTDDRIWNFLDNGTNIRWAIMSTDWTSKTHVGLIPSTFGSGRVTWKGRNSYFEEMGWLPKPGIEARNFTQSIEEFLLPRWKLQMRYAVRDAKKEMEKFWM